MRTSSFVLAILLTIALLGQSHAYEAGEKITITEAVAYMSNRVVLLEKRVELLEMELELASALKSDSLCLPRDTFNGIKVRIRDTMQEGFTEAYKVQMEANLDVYSKEINICEED